MPENNSNDKKQGGLSWSMPSSTQSPVQKPLNMPPKMPAPKPPQGPESSGSSKYIGMIAAGVIAGAVLAWGYSAFHTPSSTSSTKSDGGISGSTGSDLGIDTGNMPALGSDPALTIMSPQPAGSSVTIAKAIVSSPTWIVVYENKEGKPGNALGAGLFFPEGQAGVVELLRSTLPGKKYLVVKQVDNGDRKFSLKDDQYLSEGGAVQWVTFETN